MSAHHGRIRRVGVVAREEFRVALEGRWLFGFAALLTLCWVVAASTAHRRFGWR